MDLAADVYRLAESFPKHDLYRLTSQVTRAVVSVPANIAEGNARSTPRDYANFLSIAKGSLVETETFLLLAIRLSYITEVQAAPVMSLLSEVERMLTVLRKRLMT